MATRACADLDQLVCVLVHSRCRFIKEQDSAFAQQGSGEAQELALAHTEVLPSLFHLGFKLALAGLDISLEVRPLQCSPNVGVAVACKGVQVEADVAREEYWVLWAVCQPT